MIEDIRNLAAFFRMSSLPLMKGIYSMYLITDYSMGKVLPATL